MPPTSPQTLEFAVPNIHLPSDIPRSGTPHTVALTCPHCGRAGSFTPVQNVTDVLYTKKAVLNQADGQRQGPYDAEMFCGVRSCPNPECRGIVAVLLGGAGPEARRLRWVAPPQLIEFRLENLPEKIKASVKEAIAAHSVDAYRASALMVRRSLELLCEDKGAKGKDLKERIANLSNHVVISPALLRAADHLRILGNDAAHVEAKAYDSLDKEHATVAIELAKEILKAVYQHDDLVTRLTRLQVI